MKLGMFLYAGPSRKLPRNVSICGIMTWQCTLGTINEDQVMHELPVHKCHRLLAPRIAYLIGTTDGGIPNVAPFSNVTQVSADPQIVAAAINRESTTFKNIAKVGRFVLSVPRAEHADIVWRLGEKFSGFRPPEGISKIDASGGEFHLDLSGYGPVLKGVTGWFECEVISEVSTNDADHALFLARVTGGQYNPEFLNSDGTYRKNSMPLMQLVLNSFSTTNESWLMDWLGPDHP